MFQGMSTLAEIEKAIAELPAREQRALYRHLDAQFGRALSAATVDKRTAVQTFLGRWTGAGTAPVTEEDERKARTARLLAKHVK